MCVKFVLFFYFSVSHSLPICECNNKCEISRSRNISNSNSLHILAIYVNKNAEWQLNTCIRSLWITLLNILTFISTTFYFHRVFISKKIHAANITIAIVFSLNVRAFSLPSRPRIQTMVQWRALQHFVPPWPQPLHGIITAEHRLSGSPTVPRDVMQILSANNFDLFKGEWKSMTMTMAILRGAHISPNCSLM